MPARQIGALSLSTAGVAAIGTGVFLRIRANNAWDKVVADGNCTRDGMCDTAGYPIAADARRTATWSTIAAGVGLATLTTGILMYLMPPRRGKRERSMALAPALGADGSGIVIMGSF